MLKCFRPTKKNYIIELLTNNLFFIKFRYRSMFIWNILVNMSVTIITINQSNCKLYTSNCHIIYHLFCQWQLPSNGTNCVSCVGHFVFSSFSVGEWTVLYWVSLRLCNHLSSLETKVQFWYWTINASAIPSVVRSFN